MTSVVALFVLRSRAMKRRSSGIEKEVDALGRVVLPKDFRKKLGLDKSAKVLISMDGDTLHIKASDKICIMCKRQTEINSDLGMCLSCLEKVKQYGK